MQSVSDSSLALPDSVRAIDASQVIPVVQEKVLGWTDQFIVLLPNLVVAVLVVVAFALLARVVRGVLQRALRRASDNEQIADLLGTIAYLAVLIAGVFVALGVMHLEKTVTSLLAGVGIIGLALGFAFQDLAANFMAGIVMAVRQPFQTGNVIETQGYLGTVRHIDLRSTHVETFSGQLVQIPNQQVFGNPLVNYSTTGLRRVEIGVGVSYGEDLERVREVAREALAAIEARETDRDPMVHFDGFGGSSIDFTARVWIRFPEQDFLEVRSQMVQRIKAAFDEKDITIPFPIRTLDFGEVGGTRLSAELPELAGARAEGDEG